MSYYRTVMSVLFVTLLGFYVLNTTPFNTSTEATKGMYTVGLSIVTLVMLMLSRVEDRIVDRMQQNQESLNQGLAAVCRGQAAVCRDQEAVAKAGLEAATRILEYTTNTNAKWTEQAEVLQDFANRISAIGEAMNATIESVHTKSLDELAALRALVTKHLTDDSVESEKELKSMLNGYFPKVERELVNGYEHAKNILSKLGQAAASVLNTKPQEDGNKTA